MSLLHRIHRGGLARGDCANDDDWKGIPSHWAIYVLVEDCDAAVREVRS